MVISGAGPRSVVTTASYEARKFGVRSATPLTRARRLCPHAVYLEPDFAAYSAASKRIWNLAKDRFETIEVVGLDEAYADLTPLIAPQAAARAFVADVERETGIVCSTGIGPNKLVAKIASDCEKPRGFVVLSADEAKRRFKDSPPSLIPGIGPKSTTLLASLGIETIGHLRSTSRRSLAATFGDRRAGKLLAQSRFEDDRVVAPVESVKSRSSEITFPADVADRPELLRTLGDLAGKVCQALAARSLAGRTVGIKIRLAPFETHTRDRTLSKPTANPETVMQVARDLLMDFDPKRPVRLLGVKVSGFDADGPAEGASPNQPPSQLPLWDAG